MVTVNPQVREPEYTLNWNTKAWGGGEEECRAHYSQEQQTSSLNPDPRLPRVQEEHTWQLVVSS